MSQSARPLEPATGYVPDDARARVEVALQAVQLEHAVHLPLAIESGSRAWGFPSPDSDYDCRFIYVRPAAQHLRIEPYRDVIEMPIHEDLDVNGWDMAKALRLLLKGNAVAIEWLRSPIAYRCDPRFREDLLAFADVHVQRAALATHYLHLGRRQRRSHLVEGEEVPLKKVFYTLRPAAALRWLARHSGSLPPMNLQTLLEEAEAPSEVRQEVDELVARKAETREMGFGLIPKRIARFIDDELGVDFAVFGCVRPASLEAIDEANRLYAATVRWLDQGLPA